MKSKTLSRISLALVIFFVSSMGLTQPERFLPDRDYTLIQNPSIDRTPDIVEVTEYFWYGCPGCFAFEPLIEEWIGRQNEKVTLQRLPAMWSDLHEVHARAYYTADSLNALNSMHSKIFAAMHLDGKRLRDQEELKEIFADNDIDAVAFDAAYNSFTVNTQVNRARTLAIQYRVLNTPSMIVNGKYLVELSRQTLEIVDFLVKKEL